jgi:hypothetical protein
MSFQVGEDGLFLDVVDEELGTVQIPDVVNREEPPTHEPIGADPDRSDQRQRT